MIVPRRRVVRGGAALLAALSLAPAAATAQTTLKLAVPSVNEGLLTIRVAIDQGLLKAEGIVVDLVSFRGGGPAVQAFAGSSVDLCVCAADHVVRLANRGLDARIIVGLDEHHSYALLGRAGSAYTDVASLKGKRIGITAPGSFTDNTIRWAITKAGLRPERDFQIVGAGTGAAMRAALETGQIEAGTVVSTDVADYLATGRFRMITDWRGIPYPALVVIGRQQWADRNPALARAFVRAVSKAARLIQADAGVTAKAVKALYPNFSDAAAAEIADSARSRLSKDGSVSPQGFETMLDVVLLSDTTLKRMSKAELDMQPRLSR